MPANPNGNNPKDNAAPPLNIAALTTLPEPNPLAAPATQKVSLCWGNMMQPLKESESRRQFSGLRAWDGRFCN